MCGECVYWGDGEAPGLARVPCSLSLRDVCRTKLDSAAGTCWRLDRHATRTQEQTQTSWRMVAHPLPHRRQRCSLVGTKVRVAHLKHTHAHKPHVQPRGADPGIDGHRAGPSQKVAPPRSVAPLDRLTPRWTILDCVLTSEPCRGAQPRSGRAIPRPAALLCFVCLCELSGAVIRAGPSCVLLVET